MTLGRDDWLRIVVVAGMILLIFYGESLGLGSIYASSPLPIKVSVGDFGKTVYGLTIAGIPVSATTPGACYEEELKNVINEFVAVSCWRTTLAWNGKSITVDSNTKDALLGDFIVLEKVDVARSMINLPGQGGWMVTLSIKDIKDFYNTKVTSNPNYVKIQRAVEPIKLEYNSLLSGNSLGGLSIKDNTQILRTESKYRFYDEMPMKPGANKLNVPTHDLTLGTVVTNLQPHFYIVQTIITYVQDPNSKSTSSKGVTGTDLGKESLFDFYNFLQGRYDTADHNIHEQYQAYITSGSNKQLINLKKSTIGSNNDLIIVWTGRKERYSEIQKEIAELESIGSTSGRLEGLKAFLAENPEYKPEATNSEISRLQNENEQLFTEIDSLEKSSEQYLPPISTQTLFGLFSAVQPALPPIGSAGSGGFLVQNAFNHVYKVLFTQTSKAKYEVVANLDYTKYSLINDQVTEFDKTIILKNGALTPSETALIAPTVSDDSAPYSTNIINTQLQALGAKPANLSKTYFYATILLLGAVIVFGGRLKW